MKLLLFDPVKQGPALTTNRTITRSHMVNIRLNCETHTPAMAASGICRHRV